MSWLDLERPVVQAGMGGGLAGAALAASVSGAGGLGTIGFTAPDELAAEIAAARERTDGPLAANLLLPFARRAHWEAASRADVVTTFWGKPLRRTGRPWLHQCGSVGEARAAHAAGADGVICQGVEAGGHVRGATPALELLEQVRGALPDGYPLLVAGGLANRDDVRNALAAGARAAVLGTRFVMSEECGARRAYKERLMESRETVLTGLFGMGWPAPHRVVWNEAMEHWAAPDGSEPRWLHAVQRLTATPLARLPMGAHARMAAAQRPGRPFFGPLAPTAGGPRNLLDAGPLYAGESVARIYDIRPAGELVRLLAPGS